MSDQGRHPTDGLGSAPAVVVAITEVSERSIVERDREDERLLAEACAGERRAVATLVARLLPVVRVAMRRRLGSGISASECAALVDDGAQELFLRLFAHQGRVLRRWSPSAGLSLDRYVALVADRLAVSLARRWKQGRETRTLEDLADSLPSNSPSPEHWLQSRQALAFLFDAFQERLSPLGRRLFELLFVEEQSTASICSATGISEDSVYAWRSRLRRRALELIAFVEPVGFNREES
jgi:RNA polymerase sigma factor (sigma-70 family)